MDTPSPPAPAIPDDRPLVQAGEHSIARERDQCTLVIVGQLALVHAQQVHAVVDEALDRFGTAYVLVDSTRAGELPADTRRWIAQWHKTRRVSAVAVFGAGLLTRTLLTLLLNAASLLRKHPIPSVFVRSESAAREWLAERLAQANKSTPGAAGAE